MAQTCEACGARLDDGCMGAALHCCDACGFHLPMPPADRFQLLADEGSLGEPLSTAVGTDPLGFVDTRPYPDRLAEARAQTGGTEAFIAVRATIGGVPTVLGSFDFRFLGGSLSVAVGERICNAFDVALAEHRALVVATHSGGARMQEGTLALFQMTRTAAACARFRTGTTPFIVILGHPTMGGVAASFSSLADVRLAEPRARIGFAGPRVVEELLGKTLPADVQRAEHQFAHGQLDRIVARSEQRALLTRLLPLLSAGRR